MLKVFEILVIYAVFRRYHLVGVSYFRYRFKGVKLQLLLFFCHSVAIVLRHSFSSFNFILLLFLMVFMEHINFLWTVLNQSVAAFPIVLNCFLFVKNRILFFINFTFLRSMTSCRRHKTRGEISIGSLESVRRVRTISRILLNISGKI